MEKIIFKTSDDLKKSILGVIHNYNPNDNDIEVFKSKFPKQYIIYDFEIKGLFFKSNYEIFKKILDFLHYQEFSYTYLFNEKSFEIHAMQREKLELKPC